MTGVNIQYPDNAKNDSALFQSAQSSLFPQEPFTVATAMEVDAALAAQAPIYIGVSGGKDNQALAYRVCAHLNAIGYRAQAGAPGQMRRDPLSCQCLKIGAHHVGDATNLGVMPYFVGADFSAGTGILEGLDGDIETDLVPVLEAIGDGLGDPIDPQLDLVALKNLYALRIGIPGELDHLDRRIVDSWDMATARHGDPDLVRELGGQFMEL